MASMHRARRGNERFYYSKDGDDVAENNVSCTIETQTDYDGVSWFEGRRIVELGYLARQLSECQKCRIASLNLGGCTDEKHCGFGSILKIPCKGCGHLNLVYTGKQHRTTEKQSTGMKIFDVNTKIALGNDTEIVQLAASCEAVNFNKYILPKNQLHPKAAEVTQLYSTGSRLYHKGQPVKTETTRNVLLRFIEWLPNNALLVAHNCKNFDANVLVSHVEGMELYDKFNEKVLGFADTLPLFKVKLQKRKSYSQLL